MPPVLRASLRFARPISVQVSVARRVRCSSRALLIGAFWTSRIDILIRDKGPSYVPRPGARRREVPSPTLVIEVVIDGGDGLAAVVRKLAEAPLTFVVHRPSTFTFEEQMPPRRVSAAGNAAVTVTSRVTVPAAAITVRRPTYFLEARWFSGALMMLAPGKSCHAGCLPLVFSSKEAAADHYRQHVNVALGLAMRGISGSFHWRSDWCPKAGLQHLLYYRVRTAVWWMPTAAWTAGAARYSVEAVTTVLLVARRVANDEVSGRQQQEWDEPRVQEGGAGGCQQARGSTRLTALPAEAWHTILGMLCSHQLGQRPQPLTIGGMRCGTIYPEAPRHGELTNDARPTEGADMLINAPPWG